MDLTPAQRAILQSARDGLLVEIRRTHPYRTENGADDWKAVTRAVRGLVDREVPLLRVGDVSGWEHRWALTDAGVAALAGRDG